MSGSRLCAALLLIAAVGVLSGQSRRQQQAYAIVEGTVFRDPGLALPGAKVVLTLKDDPKAKKLLEAETNYRGEFLFRVPTDDAMYVVKASLKGYGPEEKEAAVSGEVRVSVSLVLSPQKK